MTDPTTASEPGQPHRLRTVPTARVALSTASVYPESTASAFEIAARLGYDAVEVMVGIDPVSQDVDVDQAPGATTTRCRSARPRAVPADHPAGLGQRPLGQAAAQRRDGARARRATRSSCIRRFAGSASTPSGFVEGIARSRTTPASRSPSRTCTRGGRRGVSSRPTSPGWNPVEQDYANVTLDLSHTSTSGSDPIQMVARLGDRLRHVHMTDGTGSAKDEHLVPGRGNQPCAELLELLAERSFGGSVVLEINTRKSATQAERLDDLAESLAFTRLHLATG